MVTIIRHLNATNFSLSKVLGICMINELLQKMWIQVFHTIFFISEGGCVIFSNYTYKNKTMPFSSLTTYLELI